MHFTITAGRASIIFTHLRMKGATAGFKLWEDKEKQMEQHPFHMQLVPALHQLGCELCVLKA